MKYIYLEKANQIDKEIKEVQRQLNDCNVAYSVDFCLSSGSELYSVPLNKNETENRIVCAANEYHKKIISILEEHKGILINQLENL